MFVKTLQVPGWRQKSRDHPQQDSEKGSPAHPTDAPPLDLTTTPTPLQPRPPTAPPLDTTAPLPAAARPGVAPPP